MLPIPKERLKPFEAVMEQKPIPLMQAGHELRTIQTFFGHPDIRTTMIYLHCLPPKPGKELKSPLDF